MKNKTLFLVIITLICSCAKKAQIKDHESFGDFPKEEMFEFLTYDIKRQSKCSCLNFVFDENLLNEQHAFMFLGAWGNIIFEDNEINLFEENFLVSAPPQDWITNDINPKCLIVHIPKVILSESKNVFYVKLKVDGFSNDYIFLALRNKENVWIKKIKGCILDESELSRIEIKIP